MIDWITHSFLVITIVAIFMLGFWLGMGARKRGN